MNGAKGLIAAGWQSAYAKKWTVTDNQGTSIFRFRGNGIYYYDDALPVT